MSRIISDMPEFHNLTAAKKKQKNTYIMDFFEMGPSIVSANLFSYQPSGFLKTNPEAVG